MNTRKLLVVLLYLAAATGCVALPCPESPPAGDILFTISRWSEGDAPTVRYVTLTLTGNFRYEYVGLGPRCSHLPPEGLKDIRDKVELLASQPLTSDTSDRVHAPLLVLDLQGQQYLYSLRRAPEDLKELTTTVDRWLTSVLGAKYTPLLDSGELE